jgi:hypothetical protein
MNTTDNGVKVWESECIRKALVIEKCEMLQAFELLVNKKLIYSMNQFTLAMSSNIWCRSFAKELLVGILKIVWELYMCSRSISASVGLVSCLL